MLGSKEGQAFDSDPSPTDAQILRELYPPDHRSEGRAFLRRLRTASQTGEIADDFRIPTRTTDAQVAAEDPWLRSNRNYIQLADLAAPTLAAAGRQDPVVPPLNLRQIAAQVPAAELLVLPGAHAFLFQEREALTDAVNEFLAG